MTPTRRILLVLALLVHTEHSGRGVGPPIAAALPEGPARSASGAPSNRDLPSLLVRWSWKGKPDEVVISGETAFVRSGGRLVALRVSDGSVVWDKQIAATACPSGAGPLVIGGDVVVGFEKDILVLDPASGKVEQRLATNGNVTQLLGPSPSAIAIGDDSTELLRFDPHLGEITAVRNVGRMVYDVLLRDGVILLNVDEGGDSSDDASVVVGLRADDLAEKWRQPTRAFPHFERVGEEVFLQVVDGETSHFAELDPRTGTLGRALPTRLSCANWSSDLPWDQEVVTESDDSMKSTFRRNSFETGQPVWTAQLPCSSRTTLRRDSELLIDCVRGAGRSTFLTLDWSTGKVLRQAAGLRDVRRFHSHGDLILAETWEDGVVAFDAKRFGPPESTTRSLSDEVRRILAIRTGDESPYGRGDHIGNAIADLKALGPDALPTIADEIPGLGSTALVAAAQVLTEAGYRRAAAPLAARLSGPLEEPGVSWDSWNPQFAILTALAKLGGPEEVAAVASILSDSNRSGTLRRQALAALAGIGTPPAVAAIDRALAAPARKPVSWWSPPSPQEFAKYIGLPDVEERADRALLSDDVDIDDWSRLLRASESARAARPDGTSLLVFPDSYLGGPGDLWVVEAGPSGALAGPARFTGISIHGEEIVRRRETPISARLAGNVLTISVKGGKDHSVDLKSLELDADGDGLPDVVERRIRTDPGKADSDGDGVGDSEDSTPGDSVPNPRDEKETIQLAIFRQFHLFEPPESSRELAIVVGDAALKWSGRGGPTLTLSKESDQRFLDEAGYDGIAHIRIEPREPKRPDEKDGEGGPDGFTGQLRPDERLYSLDKYRGGLNAIGYRVIVRKIGDRWVIVDLQVAYVS